MSEDRTVLEFPMSQDAAYEEFTAHQKKIHDKYIELFRPWFTHLVKTSEVEDRLDNLLGLLSMTITMMTELHVCYISEAGTLREMSEQRDPDETVTFAQDMARQMIEPVATRMAESVAKSLPAAIDEAREFYSEFQGNCDDCEDEGCSKHPSNTTKN